MYDTFNAIAPVFLIIVIGHVLNRTELIGKDIWSAIEHICFYVLLPFLIIRTLSRANLGDVPILDFCLVLIIAIVGMSLLLIVLRTLFRDTSRVSDPTFSSLFQGATRFHGFMALAIIAPLYGDPGVTLAAIALGVMVPLLNIFCVIVLSIYGDNDDDVNFSTLTRRVLTNPLILACVAGLTLNLTGIPDVLFDTVVIIGSGGLGLVLLSVGAGLQLGHAADNKLLVSAGVLIRLLGMPLLVLLMSWMIGLEGMARTIALIAGAVPSASSSYVMARKMGGDANLMSSILTFQVIVAFFTLPMFVYIASIL